MKIKASIFSNIVDLRFKKSLFGNIRPKAFAITSNDVTVDSNAYNIFLSKKSIEIVFNDESVLGDNISISYTDKPKNQKKGVVEFKNGKDLPSFQKSVQIASGSSNSATPSSSGIGLASYNSNLGSSIKDNPYLVDTSDKQTSLSKDPKFYLSFSGGGWNSHSMLSGMVAGALDAYDKENNHMLDSVKAAASYRNPSESSSDLPPQLYTKPGIGIGGKPNTIKNSNTSPVKDTSLGNTYSVVDKPKSDDDSKYDYAISAEKLELSDRKVSRLMENIDGISANSGGGWFLSHLAYSQPFREAFEDENLTNSFLTDGYYGEIRAMFDTPQAELNINKTGAEAVQDIQDAIDNLNPVASAVFDFLFADFIKDAIESIYNGAVSVIQDVVNAINTAKFYTNIAEIAAVDGGISWDTIVPNTVYAPYDMYDELSRLNFNTIQGRESWAKDKDIVLASAMWKTPVNMQMNTEKHGWWDMLSTTRDIQSRVTTPNFEKGEWFTPLSFYSTVEDGKTTAYTGALMTAGSNGKIVHHQENDSRYNWIDIDVNPEELLNPLNWDIISGADDTDIWEGGYFEEVPDQSSYKTIDSDRDGWLKTPNLDLLDPFIASSSAAAGLAGPRIWGEIGDRLEDRSYMWDIIQLEDLADSLSQTTRELSPLATIRNGTLDMPSELPGGKAWDSDDSYDYKGGWDDAFDDLSNGGYTRLLDGGYVDNNSAATMLRHIQQKDGTRDEFNLTIFHNGSSDNIKGAVLDSHNIEGLKVNVGMKNEFYANQGKKDTIIGSSKGNYSEMILPWGVAALFGKGEATRTGTYATNDGDVVYFDTLMNPKTPSSKIFDFDAFDSKLEPDWEYNQDRVRIDYYNLDVETVDNKAFGIKGGQKGNVHLFVAVNLKSWAAPYKREFLDSYDQNFEAYRAGIAENGGYEVLKDAFGLS